MKRSQFILKMRDRLLIRRTALRKSLDDQRQLLGQTSVDVGDYADAAVDAEQREINSQLAAVESRELHRINEALDRIREGLFGVCEHCGKTIPAARLQALPYVTYCITCQVEAERVGKSSVEGADWSGVVDLGSGDDVLANHNHLEML